MFVFVASKTSFANVRMFPAASVSEPFVTASVVACSTTVIVFRLMPPKVLVCRPSRLR